MVACGGAATSPGAGGSNETLTVGLLIPQTGVYAPLGGEMKKAADLYMESKDSKLGGRKTELVIADSAGNPETGKQKAKELILRKEADVLTGVVASPVAVSVADEAAKGKVPLVVANAGADELTGDDASDYVWRTSQSNYQHGYAAGVYAAKRLGTTGGVFMGADYSAGTETRDGFIAGYQASGGKDLAKQILTPFGKTQNFQPYLSKVPASAKFVYAFYAGGEAITFAKNWKQFGYDDKLDLVGAQNITDEDVLPALGDTGSGVVTVGLYSPALDNAANAKFLQLWKDKYEGTPSIVAVTTWDAMQVIDKAAGSVEDDVNGESLADALGATGEIKSPRGTFAIDPKTHNPVQDYYVRKLEPKGDGFVNTVIETIPAGS